ncbi:NAD(P)/FAD-dependent oxidoreductase [Rhizobium puerariae]|uniref:NAD(P)/FAD-dependent oxidoreductase n=1 Tax=Rhizobium puerariae TaxID=1585791 RepID=A0ABV6AMT8_9HYPH
MMPDRIVIVGAGQAGLQAAVSLREVGHSGPITLIGDEPGLPYQRPPLSKAFLLGKIPASGLDLRSPDFLAAQRIDLAGADPALVLDRAGKTVRLASGRELAYDHLVLATGARRRELAASGSNLPGIHYLRSRADAEALKARLGGAERAVVVGAGFIGLEFAAVAADLGFACTVVEAAPVLLGRAVSRATADHVRAMHEARGTRFLFGEGVARFEAGADGRVAKAVTSSGDALEADLVLVGVGVIANDGLAAESGLATDGGIVVDRRLRTSDPDISAIGDCAVAPHPQSERPLRIESVQNAIDQGRHLARVLAGADEAYAALPWFWSDQGGIKLQIAGLIHGHDRTVLRGDPQSGRFSVFCYRGTRLLGVESVNRPADHMAARRFVGTSLAPVFAEASDESLDLKRFLPAA